MTIDLNARLAAANKRREEADQKAQDDYNEEVERLIEDIALKIEEAANAEGDVRPALQAILDGAGKTVKVDVTDPQLVEEVEGLRKENQDQKSTIGRLESAKAQAESKVSQLESELAEAKAKLGPPPPAATNSMSDPDTDFLASRNPAGSEPAPKKAAAPTLLERTKKYLTQKNDNTSTERSSS